MNKFGVSPLVATLLLVAFALVVGAITMTWGKNYIEKVQEEKAEQLDVFKGAIIIGIEQLDDPLKSIQLQHITGKITREEYLRKEAELLNVEGQVGPTSCTSNEHCIAGYTCWYKIPSGSFPGIRGSVKTPGKCYSNTAIAEIQ